MGEVVQIRKPWETVLQMLHDDLDSGELTHAVLIWYGPDHGITYGPMNATNKTFLLGLLERVKSQIIETANEDDGGWEDEE